MVNQETPSGNDVTCFQKRWPTYHDFAVGAGVSDTLAQVWRSRRSIPGSYDFKIATDAAKRGIGSFDAILAELAKMRSKVKPL